MTCVCNRIHNFKSLKGMAAVSKDVGEIWTRLFDHKPFLQGEVKFFLKEFEEKRGDREVERIFEILEHVTDIKETQIDRVKSLCDLQLPVLNSNLEVTLSMCESILEKEQEQTSSRKAEWEAFIRDMGEKCARVDQTFKQKEAELREYYRLEETDIPEGIKKFMSSKGETNVRMEDIVWVKERLSLKGRFLCQYNRGTEMILPSPPVQARNPELEARCERLRWEQQEREYRAMTKNVDATLKQINRQLIGVVQFVFSVAAGFLFGYLGLELMLGGLDMRVRLLSGIMCAVIIAVAEIYFLIMHLIAEDAMISDAQNVHPPTTPKDTKEHLMPPQKNEGTNKTNKVDGREGKLHID
ncbi:hypothetical protein B566_EDAN016312 [Ephemera danica]|nr:hypothetical protein B566_EDAN016312 [Ephemera danica]